MDEWRGGICIFEERSLRRRYDFASIEELIVILKRVETESHRQFYIDPSKTKVMVIDPEVKIHLIELVI